VVYSLKQGYFCDGTRLNAVLEVLSRKNASQNGILDPFFSGIDINNTTPLQLNYGLLFAFWILFQKKNNAGLKLLREHH
jgi:hypothetical protein